MHNDHVPFSVVELLGMWYIFHVSDPKGVLYMCIIDTVLYFRLQSAIRITTQSASKTPLSQPKKTPPGM